MISSVATCRLCGKPNLKILIDLGPQPIAHRLLEKPEDEFTHPLTLHFCESCGLGQITNPIDPETLYKGYNYCFSAWKPEPHRETELNLICAHKKNAKVFEIGCNDGLFLEQLKMRSQRLCVGLEPNSFAVKVARETRGLTVYETFLDDTTVRDALATHGKFDLVVARQVLEHVSDIGHFFKSADRLLADDGMIFIDVPDVGPGLRVGDCTIAWEEHVNYFTEDVLVYTLDRFGFAPVELKKFNYSGGTLAILAKRNKSANDIAAAENLHSLANTFGKRVADYRTKLVAVLKEARSSFDAVVIYGVGCRACAFVNGLKLAEFIDYAVDDQVERQNHLMPGSQLPIHSSQKLTERGNRSLVILAVNQENEEKVKAKTLAAATESQVQFLTVFGPSDIQRELDKFSQSLRLAKSV